MSLLTVIDRFNTPGGSAGQYVVTRPAAGTYVKGDYVPGSVATFNITASVQPLDARHVAVLPEGVSVEDTRRLWTATLLQPGRADAEADIVALPSEQGVELFWVFAIEGPWTMNGRTHYVATIARRSKR